MAFFHHGHELIDIALVACAAQSFRCCCPHEPAFIVKCLFQNRSIARVGATAEQACRKGPRARCLISSQFLHRRDAESRRSEESACCLHGAELREGSWIVQLLVHVMPFGMNQAG